MAQEIPISRQHWQQQQRQWEGVRESLKLTDFYRNPAAESFVTRAFSKTTNQHVIAAQIALDRIHGLEPGVKFSILEVYATRTLAARSKHPGETLEAAQVKLAETFAISPDDMSIAKEIVRLALQEDPNVWDFFITDIPHYMGVAKTVKNSREKVNAERLVELFRSRNSPVKAEELARELGVSKSTILHHLAQARKIDPTIVAKMHIGHPELEPEYYGTLMRFKTVYHQMVKQYGPPAYGVLTQSMIADALGLSRGQVQYILYEYGDLVGITSNSEWPKRKFAHRPPYSQARTEQIELGQTLWKNRKNGIDAQNDWTMAVVERARQDIFPVLRGLVPETGNEFHPWVAQELQNPANDMSGWKDFAVMYASEHENERFDIANLAKRIETTAKGTLVNQGLDTRLVEREQLRVETRLRLVHEYVVKQQAAGKYPDAMEAAQFIGDLSKDPVQQAFGWLRDAGLMGARRHGPEPINTPIVLQIDAIVAANKGKRPSNHDLLLELQKTFPFLSETQLKAIIHKSGLERLPRFGRRPMRQF